MALALRYVWNRKYRGLLLRRTFPELEEIIDRTQNVYPVAVPGAEYKASNHVWEFPSGAKISLGHMQHEKDKYKYRGREFQYVGFDELTAFTETQYLYLFSRCRSTDPSIRPMVRSTSNPGDVGHAWVKRRFRIGINEPGKTIFEETVLPDGEIVRSSRIFIPGRLSDNPSLLRNDPEYLARLSLLPEIERRRLSEGLWEAEGTGFPELNPDVHSFDHDIPPEWEVFGSFDWGAAKPWSYALWAVDYDGRVYRFAERYGAREEHGEYLDEGLRQTDNEIARDILSLEREFHVKPRYRVACKATYASRPNKLGVKGPAPEETMRAEGVYFQPGDQDRIPGRRQIHHRLALDEDGKPWLYAHRRCRAFWQFMPVMLEDEDNPEDILEKNQPDHVFEETRMAVMSRPMKPRLPQSHDAGSFQAERRRMIRAKQIAARHGISMAQAYGRMR